MARKKTPKARINVKASLSRRLKEVRQEIFGEHGGPELARRLGLPARTWYNYETGVTVPAEVLLAFIDQTGTNPSWLLTGEGAKLQRGVDDGALAAFSAIELIRRGLEKLENTPPVSLVRDGETLTHEVLSDFVTVKLVPLEELVKKPAEPIRTEGTVMVYRAWLSNPASTVAVRLEDDAMHPILPAGSIVAVDRSATDPHQLQGSIVAAAPDGHPVIRWLELSGRHAIFRPNHPTREHPLVPVELHGRTRDLILGQVVWSWSRFGES